MSKKKSNSLILALGIKKKWISKYFEKNKNELNFITYQDLQIQQFVKMFLLQHGLDTVFLQLFYKKHSLVLFLIYTVNLIKLKKKLILKKIKLKKIEFYIKIIAKFFKTKTQFPTLKKQILKLKHINYNNNLPTLLNHFFLKQYKINKLQKNSRKFNAFFSPIFQLKKRLYFLKYVNLLKKHKKSCFVDKFINKVFITLKLFLNKKINITLIVKQLNQIHSLSKQQKLNLSFNVLNLKKFEKIKNFKFNVNLLYSIANSKKKLSQIISNFISVELSKIKNPKFFNFFLKFAINAIKYLLFFSNKFKGLILQVKGNLSKNPRAVKKTISLGNSISKTKINTNLEYSETVCFFKKGTLGVKTWITY